MSVPSPSEAPAELRAPPEAVRSLSSTEVVAVDDARSLATHTQWIDGSAGERLGQSRLLLSGLYCAACAGTIEDALRQVPGVGRADVNGTAQRAVVVWDPARTRMSALIEAVRRCGYGAFPDTGAQAVAEASRESRKAIWRLFVAAFCMMQVMMYASPAYIAEVGDMSVDIAQLLRWASWILSAPVLLFASGPFLRGAWFAIKRRRIGMDVPVALGIVVTFVASSVATFQAASAAGPREVYFDSMTMFVCFLLVARWLETRARQRAAQSLDAVMRRLPDAVERLLDGGGSEWVTTAELAIGDRLRVRAGQAFAADGVVEEGATQVDEAVLTGESRPVERRAGDEVAAGSLNLGAPVLVRVTGLGAQTRYQRIVSLVERALSQRPTFALSADRIAGPFLWGVLGLAALAWLVWNWIDPSRAVWVAVSVLIVTCPCALSLGAPVALIAAAGEMARRGVLIQRLDALELLTRVRDVVFDKTGTLTEDRLVLQRTLPLADPPGGEAAREGAWRALARELAGQSSHPLAKALVEGLDGAAVGLSWSELREVAGQGLEARCDTAGPYAGRWRLGSAAWCSAGAEGVQTPAVWLAREVDAGWQAVLRAEFDELLRADAIQSVAQLLRSGIEVHLLSGDHRASVAAMALRLGLAPQRARALCTPPDKLTVVEGLQASDRVVAMVGDGINDAPVLARADVSVAMGSAAALAQARADVIVLSNRVGDLVALREVAIETMRIVRQNLAWALIYNLAGVPLALVGWLPPWLAGIGMALSSLLVVLNALRLTRWGRWRADATAVVPLPRVA
ncbi:MAG TPA: cation-translocating P-type ATPase [Burkholderiaceae bacterium]|nr:cation-translocating P-type ATPase [Burkholderiaceae bacterium]HMY99685.1 cation-translocating P-type ATPase [Burkholderiaceae bacterium]HNG80676.1 cation-translocating P-type ATPase [Burkholderiaceae bacterium]